MPESRFHEQVAVVTGGAQGLGARCAARLAEAGAAVAVWDYDVAGAEVTVAKIEAAGGRAVAIRCNVADVTSVDEAASATVDQLGVPQLALAAAGVINLAPFLDVEVADFSRVISVNLTGVFLTVQACARRMAAAGLPGSIVTVSSVAGRGPRPDQAAYAASKAAVISLTQSAAVALAPLGINVNAVCPGVVDTEMTRRNARERGAVHGMTGDEALRQLLNRIPLGRMQTQDDVADVVEFLLSRAASYVTGQALNACGGLEFD